MHRTTTTPSPINLITTWLMYLLRVCRHKSELCEQWWIYNTSSILFNLPGCYVVIHSLYVNSFVYLYFCFILPVNFEVIMDTSPVQRSFLGFRVLSHTLPLKMQISAYSVSGLWVAHKLVLHKLTLGIMLISLSKL